MKCPMIEFINEKLVDATCQATITTLINNEGVVHRPDGTTRAIREILIAHNLRTNQEHACLCKQGQAFALTPLYTKDNGSETEVWVSESVLHAPRVDARKGVHEICWESYTKNSNIVLFYLRFR